MNARRCNVHLNGKKTKMTSDVTMYKYKNILQAQQTLEEFRIPGKVG